MPPSGPDRFAPERAAAAERVQRGEQLLHDAVRAAMTAFLQLARRLVLDEPGALTAADKPGKPEPDPPPPRLDAFPNDQVWLELVREQIVPVLAALFGEAFRAVAASADITDQPYRTEYMEQVFDRLVIWPRGVFEVIRLELLEAHQQGEGIPRQVERIGNVLRIDATSRRLQAEIDWVEKQLDAIEALTGDERALAAGTEAELRQRRRDLYTRLDDDRGQWEWMAERIARTETMGAINGGSHAAAQAWQADSGEQLFKRWLATNDERTRDTHVRADGQVRPLNEPYDVGGFDLRHPGDPRGPGHEVIQCRCTELYLDSGEAPAAQAEYADKLAQLAADESLQAAAAPNGGTDMPPAPTQLPIGWRGVIAPMGVPTGDGRMLAVKTAAELRLRDMPLVFLAQDELSTGHDGATITGNIENVWLQGDDNLIRGSGRFDLGSPEGMETARLLHEGFARWVSADPDDVVWEEAWFNAAGEEIDPPTLEEWIAAEEAMWAGEPSPLDDRTLIMRMAEYRLVGCTFVSQPAFNEAVIEPVYDEAGLTPPDGASVVGSASLVASAAAASLIAGAGPLRPPAAWFADPRLDRPTALTIGDDGRVYGHLATWDTCHTGFSACVRPPRSAANYAYFHTGAVVTDEGTTTPVGKITLGGGHAGPRATMRGAVEHYDNAGSCVGIIRAYEDRHGIAVAGAVVPGVTEEQLAALRRCPLSGDWREVGGRLELIAALAVVVPGFPVPRLVAAASGAGDPQSADPQYVGMSLVAAGALPSAAVMAQLEARKAARRRDMDPAEIARLVVKEIADQDKRRAHAKLLAVQLGLDPQARARAAAARLAVSGAR